jgi:glycosyltransferase involved in cell wall biosynthesis
MVNSDIFVVIPSYNERNVLGTTVAELAPFGYSIVVVDDGSPIPERQYLSDQVNASTWYLRHVSNLGAGAAVETGTKFALSKGAKVIESSDRALIPVAKRILLKLGVFVSWVFTGMWLTDTHNGFRAVSRTAAQQIHLTENGYAHCTEILELIRKAGVRYMEVPTTVRYTTYSLAKGQSMWNSINILFDLVLRKLFR